MCGSGGCGAGGGTQGNAPYGFALRFYLATLQDAEGVQAFAGVLMGDVIDPHELLVN